MINSLSSLLNEREGHHHYLRERKNYEIMKMKRKVWKERKRLRVEFPFSSIYK